MRYNTDYAYRVHDRLTDDDPELATVMYSTSGPEGPWFDMATGHPDWIDEILGALRWCEDERRMRAAEEAARFALEMTRYENLVDVDQGGKQVCHNSESQGDAKLPSNSEDYRG